MEQMTKRKLKGTGYYMKCSETCPHDCQEACDCEEFDKFVDLLAAYEKTGLEPQELERIVDAYGRGLSLRTESAQRLEMVREIQTDRLREIAAAERDGRCVVLPCKVGDTVFMATGRSKITGYEEDICDGFYIGRNGVLQVKAQCYTGNHGSYGVIGQTAELTREAAEAALKNRSGGTV